MLWDLVAETGLFRLKGHKNEVTSLVFVPEHDSLISCSKDACIRVWNLQLQHCTQVVTLHRGEIWSMDLSLDGKCLVTGSLDEQLLCFRVKSRDEMEAEEEESKRSELLAQSGTLVRRNRSRIQQVQFDRMTPPTNMVPSPSPNASPKSRYFDVLRTGKVFELYRVRTAKETIKKAKRRLKRKREKQGSGSGGEPEGNNSNMESEAPEPTQADEFELETTISLKHKIKSFYFTYSRSGKLRVVLALASNSVEVYEVNHNSETAGVETLRIHTLDSQGHRGDVRFLSVSNDNSMILSCSYNGIKVWNANSGNCLRTCAGGYGLCSTFVVGDKYACIGTKAGSDRSVIRVNYNIETSLLLLLVFSLLVFSLLVFTSAASSIRNTDSCYWRYWRSSAAEWSSRCL